MALVTSVIALSSGSFMMSSAGFRGIVPGVLSMVANGLKESSHKVMLKSHVRGVALEVPVTMGFSCAPRIRGIRRLREWQSGRSWRRDEGGRARRRGGQTEGDAIT